MGTTLATMDACSSCPNRWHADLFDALGEHDKAAQIRRAGCSWFWRIDVIDDDTGQTKTISVCGAAVLPRYLNQLGGLVSEASSSVQSARNVVAEGLSLLAGQRVDGSMRSVRSMPVSPSVSPSTQSAGEIGSGSIEQDDDI